MSYLLYIEEIGDWHRTIIHDFGVLILGYEDIYISMHDLDYEDEWGLIC